MEEEGRRNTGSPIAWPSAGQPDAREGQVGRNGVAERYVVPLKSGSITEETSRKRTCLDAESVVGRLNRKLTGWANYFSLGPVSSAYKALDKHATQRLRQWLCKKHKVRGKGVKHYPNQYLREHLGLVNLPARTRDLPWAKA